MKTYFCFMISLLLLGISCNTSHKRKIDIPDGKVGLIGYGSLTSKKQMESQLGKPYDRPVEIVHLEGFQRTWDGTTPNSLEFPPVDYVLKCAYENDSIFPSGLSVLNITENEKISINCCFFIINEDDLKKIDYTEAGYKRIDVTDRIKEFEIGKGTVWAYQSKEEFIRAPSPDSIHTNVLPRLYLDFLEAAFRDLGEEYKKEFYATTLPIPEQVVLDCSMIDP